MTIPQLIKKLDAVFSKYIRLRDADSNGICRCITCNAPHHWTHMDNGHFQKRQYMSTRFSEYNCHAQCRRCNWLLQGNDKVYSEVIEQKYGIEVYALLQGLKYTPKKWSHFELEFLIEDYKKKVTELLKLKKCL
jgi:hypothetical protein